MQRFYVFLHLRPLLLLVAFPWLLHWFDHAGWPAAMRWSGELGLLLMLAALAILLPAHWQLYRPAQWTTQRSAFDEPNRLVTSGAYRHIRHPQLLGIYLGLLGEALLFRSWLIAAYALLILFSSARVALGYESSRLHEAFGASYEAYIATTKRFLPGIF